MTPDEFEKAQDQRIKRAKAAWKKAAAKVREAEEANAPIADQIKLVDAWNEKAREFFRVFNEAVANPGPLRGEAFQRWKEPCVSSVVNVLHELLDHKANIDECRSRLNISEGKYKFAPAVFSNMQSLYAFEDPEGAARLKAEFEKVGLPTYGFDHPRPVKERASLIAEFMNPLQVMREATSAVPSVKYALGVAGVVSGIAIVASLGVSLRVAAFGTVVMVVLMVLLVVFARMTTTLKDGQFVNPILFLLWSSVSLTMLTAAFLFTSVFFKWPADLGYWLAPATAVEKSQP